MGTNPYPDQNSDQSNQYGGGYTGYTPPSQNDPYSSQQYTDGNAGNTGGQQDYQYGQHTYGQQQQYTYGQQQQQQYSSYQPPLSATQRGAGSSGAGDTALLGLDGKKAGLASYALFFLSGIVIFLLERRNRFVRFCAAQSTLFFGAVFVVYLFLRLLSAIYFVGFLLSPILGCATFVLLVPSGLIWIFLMIQAYRGVKIKLPVFGDYAEHLVTRFTKR